MGALLEPPPPEKSIFATYIRRKLSSGATLTAIFSCLSGIVQHAESATCCTNTTSGQDFDSPCVCLVDNTQYVNQNLTQGGTRLYHWVLEQSSSELVTLVPRGNVTFKLSPCNGSAWMEIKTASPGSWSYLPSFSSAEDFNPIAFTTSVQAAEYTVFVTAGIDADLAFEIATYNTLLDYPTQGGGGILEATMPTSSTAGVSIFSSETGAEVADYRLYWSSLVDWDGLGYPKGCVIPTAGGMPLMNNSNCLFSSVCGMERAAERWSEWVSLPSGIEHTFEVPVVSRLPYIFNVAMRDSNNISTAYHASNMTFSLTTYQDCVADDECESQVSDSLYISLSDMSEQAQREFVPLQSDTTIVTVTSAVLGALVALVFSMKLLHSSMQRTIRTAAMDRRNGLQPPTDRVKAKKPTRAHIVASESSEEERDDYRNNRQGSPAPASKYRGDIGERGTFEEKLSIDVRRNQDDVDDGGKSKDEWENANTSRTPIRGTRRSVSSPPISAGSASARRISARGDVRNPQSAPGGIRNNRSEYASLRDGRDARPTRDDDRDARSARDDGRDDYGERGTRTRSRYLDSDDYASPRNGRDARPNRDHDTENRIARGDDRNGYDESGTNTRRRYRDRDDYTSLRDGHDGREDIITRDTDRDGYNENGNGTRRLNRERDVEAEVEQSSSKPSRRAGRSNRENRWQAQSEQMRRSEDVGRRGRTRSRRPNLRVEGDSDEEASSCNRDD